MSAPGVRCVCGHTRYMHAPEDNNSCHVGDHLELVCTCGGYSEASDTYAAYAAHAALIEAHRPYGMDCKCGRPINSDRDWAQHLIAVLQLAEEWGVFTERNSRGEIVNAQLGAADRDHAEELAQRVVAQFWRRHEGVAGAGIVKPEPEVRTRLVGPWREVSE